MQNWEKKLVDSGVNVKSVRRELWSFEIETPSWGFADSGTRFGPYKQAGSAGTCRDGYRHPHGREA